MSHVREVCASYESEERLQRSTLIPSKLNSPCKCAHIDHRSAGRLQSPEQRAQEAVLNGGSYQPDVNLSDAKNRVTHRHIWSRLCWRCSLADKCRRSCQRCWCTLLRHTLQEWCYIHQYLKHRVSLWATGSILSKDTSVDLQVPNFFIWDGCYI